MAHSEFKLHTPSRPFHGPKGLILAALATLSLLLQACSGVPTRTSGGEQGEPLRSAELARIQLPPGQDPLFALLAAELALQETDLDGAAYWYAEAAAQSEDMEIVERAARIALFASDEAVAARSVERWLSLDPQAAGAAQAALGLALRRGDTDRAAELARDLVDSHPDGWRLVGQALGGQAAGDIATEVLLAVAGAAALREDYQRLLGFSQIALQLEQAALAQTLADEAVDRFPETSAVFVWRAQLALNQGREDDALADFHRGLALEPDKQSLRLGVAALLNDGGDADGAHALLTAVSQDETLRSARLALAAAADDSPRLDALYREMSADAGLRDGASLRMLGQLSELLERPDEALGWYRQIEAPELRAEALMREAIVLEQLDRLDEARAALARRRDEFQLTGFELANTYLLEGEFLRRRGEHQMVFDLYSRALNRLGEETRLLYARALAAERIDLVDQAERDLRRLLELDPEDAHALNALGYTLTDRTDRHQEALGYIERALALMPDDPAIIDSMGWVKYRLGDLEAAVGYLQRAYEQQQDGEIAAHLGEVLWMLERREEALDVWRDGLGRDPESRPLLDTLRRFGIDGDDLAGG